MRIASAPPRSPGVSHLDRGRGAEQALTNAEEALGLYVEALREDGRTLDMGGRATHARTSCLSGRPALAGASRSPPANS